MKRPLRILGVLVASVIFSVCGETTPPQTDTTEIAVAHFSLATDSIEISAPGEGRVLVTKDDSIAIPTISVSAPFTASFESTGGINHRLVLVIDAAAAGVGYVKIQKNAYADSVKVVASALTFKQIAVAWGYACGIASDDRAWCWGDNSSMQIGAPVTPPCLGSACQYYTGGAAKLPLPVSGNHKFASIDVTSKGCTLDFSTGGCGETCAITATGDTYCWGFTSKTGAARVAPDRQMSSVVSALSNDVSYYGIKATPCGLNAQGEAYCMTATGSSRVQGPFTFSSYGTSYTHSCGVSSGDVYCWGTNANGELGIGSTDATSHPDPTKAIASVSFTAVEVGEKHTCALGADNKLYCWGRGITSPRVQPGSGVYKKFSTAFTTGSVCGLMSVGAVDCWSSLDGQPSSVQLPAPLMAIGNGFGGLGAPLEKSCGLSFGGEVYCWGTTFVAKKLGAP